MTETTEPQEVTIREASLSDDSVVIDMVHYEDGWIPAFNEYIPEKEGTEDLFEPWIVTRLDLPSDQVEAAKDDRIDEEYMILDNAATVEYDAESREWHVEINENIDPQ